MPTPDDMHGAADEFGGQDTPHSPFMTKLRDELKEMERACSGKQEPKLELTIGRCYFIVYQKGPKKTQYVGRGRLVSKNPPDYDPGTLEFQLLDAPLHDGDYQMGYFDPGNITHEATEWKIAEDLVHRRRLSVMHAIWLCAYDDAGIDELTQRAARLLRKTPEEMFAGFDADWMDRCWCSRPTDWKPEDSLNMLTK